MSRFYPKRSYTIGEGGLGRIRRGRAGDIGDCSRRMCKRITLSRTVLHKFGPRASMWASMRR